MPLNERLQRIRDGKIALGEGYETIVALLLDGMDPTTLTASEFTLLRGVLERLYREFDKDLCACNSLTAAVLKIEHGLEDLNRLPWKDLVRDRLFRDYLVATSNTDPIIEHVIVRVRKRLFLGNETLDPAPVVAAVAQQCFFNKYIYEIDPEEHALLTERCESFSGDALESLCLGMYRPPLSFLDEDAARRLAAASHPDSLDGAITRLVREPLEALDLAASFLRRAINDPISRVVREQYEQNPYPRWYRLAWEKNNLNTGKLPSNARILCAGCGTGLHVLNLARSFPEARILGLDLSVASLAFGMQQARRFGFDRVEFIHGDLVEVEQLGKTFDLVECAGVLHSLGDDTRMAGWRALARVLVPGGLLRILCIQYRRPDSNR